MTKEQLKIEINHILDSGANDIRLIELFERYHNNEISSIKEQLETLRNNTIGTVNAVTKIISNLKN